MSERLVLMEAGWRRPRETYPHRYISDKVLFLFDFDGVLATGGLEWKLEVLGGYRIISMLRKKKKKVAIVGSGSNWSTMELWATLRRLGFMVEVDEVWSAARVAALHLSEMFGKAKCYVIGEEGLKMELSKNGHKIVDSWRDVEAVVVGHDRYISYRKMSNAIKALITNDAYFLAVNKVRWYYLRDEGPVLSPGAIVAALEYQTGKQAVIAGKPSLIHFKKVLEKFGVDGKDSVMIGDVVESDLVPAKTLGLTTVYVKSIEKWTKYTESDLSSVDLVVSNVDELTNFI
jgi:HAD superfamily hydrolase (TIGR01450 family)